LRVGKAREADGGFLSLAVYSLPLVVVDDGYEFEFAGVVRVFGRRKF
jgi:hypothetical protein